MPRARSSAGARPLPDPEAARTALAGFVGSHEQRPPVYSARKLGGQTAHRAARAGTQLDLPPRRVTIESIDLLDQAATSDGLDLRIDLRCGPGTYVRSIARDLGDRLGCGGYLAALRRTEAAGLRADEALPPDRLEALASSGRLEDALVPVADLLPLPRLDLDDANAALFRHGSAVAIGMEGMAMGRHVVLTQGALLGIGRLEAGLLQPEKVVAETSA